MLYSDTFHIATRNITRGKIRSTLTILGIVIGIASVIALMSIGGSAQKLILASVRGIGSNLIIIVPGSPNNGKFSSFVNAQGVVTTSLRQEDVDSLAHEPSINELAPLVSGQADIIYGNNDAMETYQGVTANMFEIRNLLLESGNAFTESDVTLANHVAVIGPDLATTLFGQDSNPINKIIRIKNTSFRVIGVLSNSGVGSFGINQGNIVMIPITVAQKEILGISYFNTVVIRANSDYDVAFTTSRITFDLARNHGITNPNNYDFNILTQADILSVLGNITSILTFFLAAIAFISLIVGGIGIMNIMMVSVTERTREIGLLKAVGATNNDILQQFLIESVLLTFAGGVIGIMLGAFVVGLIYVLFSMFDPELGWILTFPLSSVIMALAVSGIVGITFGIYPAHLAAQENPIDSLRHE